jgi:hypothetical protein
LNQQKSRDIYDKEDATRPSIVKKSLNNVKNIIRKAKDGLMASSQGETTTEMQPKGYANPFEVNHDQVQIELEGSIAAGAQEWPQGISNGQYSSSGPLKGP